MEYTTRQQQGIYEVTMSGKFTFTDHPEFRNVLEHIGHSTVEKITFFVSQLEFVDSAALGMLLLALDEAEKHHKSLVISGAQGQVKKMFDVARFNTMFALR